MKHAILAITLFVGLLSCSHRDICHNLSFEETSALGVGKPFCIVLVDHLQFLSGEYEWALTEQHRGLTRGVVYNIVDIEAPDGEMYNKWLCPLSVPLTCVFSAEDELIDLIEGDDDKSFSYIGEALGQLSPTEGSYPNRFGSKKARLIPLLNDALQNGRLLSNGVFLAAEVNALVDSLRYPYSVGLKLTGSMMTADTLAAKSAALELLELETPYYLATYKTDFITAHTVLDPTFDIADEPVIRVAEEEIVLGERPIDKLIPLEIEVTNDGGKPLTVSNVITDCGCIRKMDGGGEVVIAPHDSVKLRFAMSPYREGEVHQTIMLVSNGINNPQLRVNVVANFKREKIN
jgi:hypothetical protein